MSPDVATHDGWTPLMAAASRGQPDVVRELLVMGADPNARNHEWMISALKEARWASTLADLPEANLAAFVVAAQPRR